MDTKTKATLGILFLEQQHETFIFPEDTDETVEFVAAAANTWSAWTEITDGAVTFTSKLSTNDGHISAMVIEEVDTVDKRYMIEVSTGPNYSIISRHRFTSGAAPILPALQFIRVRSKLIHAGETIYYRMKCEQAGPKKCKVYFRYHFH
ncbi:unnamed protein product [marine sediment metagenome]|uniref:Uncharacterized protein n=1 Tax=marine sediment metagenome TaxID=412755 RepID=X1DUZ5_9ZZZZ